MYQVFIEKYATNTLVALLLLTMLSLAVAAIAEYIVARQTLTQKYVAVPLVRALRHALAVSTALGLAFTAVLVVTSPGVGSIALCIGILLAGIRFAHDAFVIKCESLLWVVAIVGLFAALLPVPVTHATAMPNLYALVAVLPLPLLKLIGHYRFEVDKYLLWG